MGPRLTVLDVYRMSAIKIRSRWNTIRIPVPESPRVPIRLESHRVIMRAQTIEVRIRWETRAKAEVLGLEDKCCSGRVEEDFSRACTLYCETEGILCIVETNIAFIGRYTAPRTRKYRLWNLVNLIPFVLNLDVDAVRYTFKL